MARVDVLLDSVLSSDAGGSKNLVDASGDLAKSQMTPGLERSLDLPGCQETLVGAGEDVRSVTNEADFVEEMVRQEKETSVSVTANSDAISGLDKGVDEGARDAYDAAGCEAHQAGAKVLFGRETEPNDAPCKRDLSGFVGGGVQIPMSGSESRCSPIQEDLIRPLVEVEGSPSGQPPIQVRAT
jgi:hypothetical protein